MYLYKTLSTIFNNKLRNGLYFKARNRSISKLKAFTKTKSSTHSGNTPLKIDDRIVIVGIGVSTVHLLKSLSTFGCKNVTVIHKDDLFGGKCVNYGCMPSEYVFSNFDKTSNQSNNLNLFIQKLSQTTKELMMSYQYNFINDEALKIENNKLILKSNLQLDFDKLFLATGSSSICNLSQLKPTINLHDFWNLESGQLTIVTDTQLTALSIAEIAKIKGLEVTVIFTEKPDLLNLPSVKYFIKAIEKNGIKIYFNSLILSQKSKQIIFKSKSIEHSIVTDHILWLGNQNPTTIEIEGQKILSHEVDLQTASHIQYPNIFFLGETAGMLSATECELYSELLCQYLITQNKINLNYISSLPVRIHAKYSLAFCGEPWTLLSSHWNEIDFRSISASAVTQKEGKLWYLFNSNLNMVEAIHICHANASELISIAKLLMQFPVNHINWKTHSVHPSYSEIFNELSKQVMNGRSFYSEHDLNIKSYRVNNINSYLLKPNEYISKNDFDRSILFGNTIDLLLLNIALSNLNKNLKATISNNGKISIPATDEYLNINYAHDSVNKIFNLVVHKNKFTLKYN